MFKALQRWWNRRAADIDELCALAEARGAMVEREACARMCEVKANENADKWEGDEAKAASWMMLQCAAAIRKRG